MCLVSEWPTILSIQCVVSEMKYSFPTTSNVKGLYGMSHCLYSVKNTQTFVNGLYCHWYWFFPIMEIKRSKLNSSFKQVMTLYIPCIFVNNERGIVVTMRLFIIKFFSYKGRLLYHNSIMLQQCLFLIWYFCVKLQSWLIRF